MIKLRWTADHPVPDQNTRQQMNSMREHGLLTDMALSSEKRIYHCHKIILSHASNYVRGLIKVGTHQGKLLVISLGDVHQTYMESLLEYLYLGFLMVDPQNVHELCKLADRLRIKFLVDGVYDLKNLKPNSIISKKCQFSKGKPPKSSFFPSVEAINIDIFQLSNLETSMNNVKDNAQSTKKLTVTSGKCNSLKDKTNNVEVNGKQRGIQWKVPNNNQKISMTIMKSASAQIPAKQIISVKAKTKELGPKIMLKSKIPCKRRRVEHSPQDPVVVGLDGPVAKNAPHRQDIRKDLSALHAQGTSKNTKIKANKKHKIKSVNTKRTIIHPLILTPKITPAKRSLVASSKENKLDKPAYTKRILAPRNAKAKADQVIESDKSKILSELSLENEDLQKLKNAKSYKKQPNLSIRRAKCLKKKAIDCLASVSSGDPTSWKSTKLICRGRKKVVQKNKASTHAQQIPDVFNVNENIKRPRRNAYQAAEHRLKYITSQLRRSSSMFLEEPHQNRKQYERPFNVFNKEEYVHC